MAAPPYIPEFPYSGNQVIISSDRVLVHSKNDSIFLFGKKAIGLSTVGTLNVDANRGVIIASPIIELGLTARQGGQRVIRGNDFLEEFDRLLAKLETFSDSVSTLKSNPEDFAASIPVIASQAVILRETTKSVRAGLQDTLSTVTYTV